MFSKRILFLLSAFIFFAANSVVAYQGGIINIHPVDAYPNRSNSNGIAVAVDPYDSPERAEEGFGKDVTSEGFIPVNLIIENWTNEPVSVLKRTIWLIDTNGAIFRPIDSDVMYEAFKKSKTGAYLATGLFGLAATAQANKKMRTAWEEKELPDRLTILPRKRMSGFVYFQLPWDKKFRRCRLHLEAEGVKGRKKGPIEIALNEGSTANASSRAQTLPPSKSGQKESPQSVRSTQRQVGKASMGIVRVGVISDLGDKYFKTLAREINRHPSSDIVKILERIDAHNLDIGTADIVGQRYQLDVIISVASVGFNGGTPKVFTKLVDLYHQKIVKLNPVQVGTYGDPGFGWEKKLVKKQRKAIGALIDMIESEKRQFQSVQSPSTRTTQPVTQQKKVQGDPPTPLTREIPEYESGTIARIGVLTDLDKKYFTRLKGVLEKNSDCQVTEIFGQASWDTLDVNAALALEQRYGINIIIAVTQRFSSNSGTKAYTKLLDTSHRRVVELSPTKIGPPDLVTELYPGWENKLIQRQLKHIRRMISQINGEKG